MRATWSQGFEAVRNDADMNVFAARDQEFWSIPVVREKPTRPGINRCELWKGHTAQEHLGDSAWSKK
jgi:hypothetical protein